MKRILFVLLAVLTAFSVYLTVPKLDAMNVAESPGWYAVKKSNVIDEVTDGDKVYPIAQNNNYYSSTNGFRTNPETFVTKWDASPSYYHVYHTIKLDNTIDKLYVTKTDGTVIFEIDVNKNLDYTKGDHITAGIRWDKVNGVEQTRFYYEFNGETIVSLTNVKEYKLYYTTTANLNKVYQDNNIVKNFDRLVFEFRNGKTYYLYNGTLKELNINSKIIKNVGRNIYLTEDQRYLNIGYMGSINEVTLESDIVSNYGNIMLLENGDYITISDSTVNIITLEDEIEASFGTVLYKLVNGKYVTLSGTTVNEITLEDEVKQHFGYNMFLLKNDKLVSISGSTVTEATLESDIVDTFDSIIKLENGNYMNLNSSDLSEFTLESDIEVVYSTNFYRLENGKYININGTTVTEITLESDIEVVYSTNFYRLENGKYININGTTVTEITLESDIEQAFNIFYKLTNGKYVTISGSTVNELEIPEFTKVTKLYYGNGYTTYQKIEYMPKGTAIDASFEEDKPTTLLNYKGFSHYSLTKDGTRLPIGTVLVEDFTVHSVLKDVKIPIKVHIDNQVDTLYYYVGDVIELETPVKDGYLFKHWSLKPDGPEASLVAGNTYTNVPKEFYAVWDKTYTVTFVNGYDIHSEQIVVENQRVTAPEAPKKLDHKFVGWYKDHETTEVFKITDVITEDTTLYAKFISSDQGGGIIPTPKPGNLTNSDLILIGVGSVVLLLAVVVFFNRKK